MWLERKMLSREVKSRFRGMLYGLAIGDALGAAVEFQPRDSYPKVLFYRGGGPHPIKAGEWTDDTSMALALADALGRCGSGDLHAQMDNYLAWRHSGAFSVNGTCFDIGGTVGSALRKYAMSRNPLTSGLSSESASGNGAIMRLAPAVIYARDFDNFSMVDVFINSTKTTHASKTCLTASSFLGWMLWSLATGETVNKADTEVCSTAYFQDTNCWDGLFADLHRDDVKSSGYVIDTLQAALWCFHRGNSFREVVLLAANLGGDSDTVGAVAGQLAGAYWGMDAIDHQLLEGLARKDMIEEALKKLDVAAD